MRPKKTKLGLRERRVTRVVWIISGVLVGACIGWSVLVQVIVPDACSYDPPPSNAQYLHCD